MDLVAVDWFKDSKRIDHVARRKGCAAQVAAEKGLFSMVVNVQVSLAHQLSLRFLTLSTNQSHIYIGLILVFI
jgi:hypothetical protein